MAKEKIGIIMPCYYSSHFIRKAFVALSEQTKKDFIEVILINDCSPNTDCNYQDLIKEFDRTLNIKYLKTEKNSGPGLARQLGLNHCDCPWVMFHDDDDMLDNPYVIETYLEIIKQYNNKTIGCILSPQIHIWGDNKREYMDCPTICGNIYNLNLIRSFGIEFNTKISYYEEDRFFMEQFWYNLLKEQTKERDLIYLKLHNLKPNYIAYQKFGHKDSICSITKGIDQSRKILKSGTQFLIFYNTLLDNEFNINFINERISNLLKYTLDFGFRYFNKNDLSFEDRKDILEFYVNFTLVKEKIEKFIQKGIFINDTDYQNLISFCNHIFQFNNNINQPLIGIIMPCYYSSAIIKRALTMLSWQTKKDLLEIIMVNDCSPNTECEYQDLIQEFQGILNIKYLKTEKNSGPGVARQIGINNCNCPWVMFHDDDDMLNSPYVIEGYLQIINSQASDLIIGAILGSHLQFWNQNSYFKKEDQNFTGNLFNLNLIKLFNVSFKELSFDEDTYFGMEYNYYLNKANHYFPLLQWKNYLYVSNYIPNFIAYTKQVNFLSICSTMEKLERILKAFNKLEKTFEFYINQQKDKVLKQYIEFNLSSDLSYLIFFANQIYDFQLSPSEKQQCLIMCNKLNILLETYSPPLEEEDFKSYLFFMEWLL